MKYLYLRRTSPAGGARHLTRVLALAMVIQSYAVQSQELMAPGECSAMKRIVEHIKNDFSGVRGAALSEQKHKVSLELPGYRTCYVHQAQRTVYRCESKILSKESNRDTLRNRKLDAFARCLGPSWVKNTRLSEFFVSLSDVDAERAIIIAVDAANVVPEYYLRVDIYRMNQ